MCELGRGLADAFAERTGARDLEDRFGRFDYENFCPLITTPLPERFIGDMMEYLEDDCKGMGYADV